MPLNDGEKYRLELLVEQRGSGPHKFWDFGILDGWNDTGDLFERICEGREEGVIIAVSSSSVEAEGLDLEAGMYVNSYAIKHDA